MDFRLSREQEEMKQKAHEFALQEIAPFAGEWDKKRSFPADTIRKMLKSGFMTLACPLEFGGAGLDYVTQNIVAEEICWGDAGLGTTMAASAILSTIPVLVAGSADQKQWWFGRQNEGLLGSLCMTEAGAGSDAAGISTRCEKAGSEYIINGRKQFITNGEVAGQYSLMATLDKKLGYKGICAFIVDCNTPGISIGRVEDTMGLRSSNTAEIIFEDVRIPAQNLLGKEGQGFYIFMKTLDISRSTISAMATGVAQRALDESLQYAKERTQFGKPIATFQAIQFKLAEMAMRIQASRLLYYEASSWQDLNIPHFSKAASLAKAFSGDTAMFCALEAVQIFGGYGFTGLCPVEKLMRDAKIFQIYEGTAEIQRLVIAGDLLQV